MPNWCDCSMVIYTDDESKKDNIQKVYNLLSEQLKRSEKIQTENETLPEGKKHSLNWDTYEVYKTLKPGITDEQIKDSMFIRGTIYDVKLDQEQNIIRVAYETAWEPMLDGWDELITDYGLKQVTLAVEPMEDLYINTDTAKKYFKEKYIVDICINDNYYEEYYETAAQVLEDMGKYFNKTFKTLKDFTKFCKKVSDDDNNDDWISFEEFEY